MIRQPISSTTLIFACGVDALMVAADLGEEAKEHTHAEDHHCEHHQLVHRSARQAPEPTPLPSLYPLHLNPRLFPHSNFALRLPTFCLLCIDFHECALAEIWTCSVRFHGQPDSHGRA